MPPLLGSHVCLSKKKGFLWCGEVFSPGACFILSTGDGSR